MASIEEKTAKYRQFFQQTVFFFDSEEGRLLGTFIEKLGGTSAPLFTNKVKCLVTSLSQNTVNQLKSQTVKQPPVANTPLQLNSPAASWDIASQKLDSRESLVLKATEMNIRVVTVEQIRSALSKYFGINVPAVSSMLSKKRSASARDLNAVALEETIHGGSAEYHVFKNPYVLIEDLHELYRPVFKEYRSESLDRSAENGKDKNAALDEVPFINLVSHPGHCPFYNPPTTDHSKPRKSILDVDTRIKYLEIKKQEAVAYLRTMSQEDPYTSFKDKPLQSNSRKQKTQNEKKPGFCECCWAKYTDLDKHALEETHKNFADNSSNYIRLDQLLQGVRRRRRALEDEDENRWQNMVLIDKNDCLLVNHRHLSWLRSVSKGSTDRNFFSKFDFDFGNEEEEKSELDAESAGNDESPQPDNMQNDCDKDEEIAEPGAALEVLIEAYNDVEDAENDQNNDDPIPDNYKPARDDETYGIQYHKAESGVPMELEVGADASEHQDENDRCAESSNRLPPRNKNDIPSSPRSGAPGDSAMNAANAENAPFNEDEKLPHISSNPFEPLFDVRKSRNKRNTTTKESKKTSPGRFYDLVPLTRSRSLSFKKRIEVKNISPRDKEASNGFPPPETLSAPEETCSERQMSERRRSRLVLSNAHDSASKRPSVRKSLAPDLKKLIPSLNNPPSSGASYKFRPRTGNLGSAMAIDDTLDPELEKVLTISPQRLNRFCRSSDGDSFHESDE